MSYHTYTTEGVVLRGTPHGEADKYFHILTRELGLIVAGAKSVRLSSSKLRLSLVDYNVGTFSFIKGKDYWKITGAYSEINSFNRLKSDNKKIALWSRFLSVIIFLINGEQKHPEIYDIARNLLGALDKNPHSEEELSAIEGLAALFLLHNLGYIAKGNEYKSIFTHGMFSREQIEEALAKKRIIIKDINQALKATQI